MAALSPPQRTTGIHQYQTLLKYFLCVQSTLYGLSAFNPHSDSVSYYCPHFTGEERDTVFSDSLLVSDKDRTPAGQSGT